MVKRRGVVLIDVLVGAVLIGIALVALNSAIGHAIARQSEGLRLAEAAMLADEQLTLVLMRGADDYGARYPTVGLCDAPFDRFRYQIDLSEGDGGEAYRVRASVFWSTPAGEKSVVLETLIAPRDSDEEFPDRAPAEPVQRELL